METCWQQLSLAFRALCCEISGEEEEPESIFEKFMILIPFLLCSVPLATRIQQNSFYAMQDDGIYDKMCINFICRQNSHYFMFSFFSAGSLTRRAFVTHTRNRLHNWRTFAMSCDNKKTGFNPMEADKCL